MLDTISPKKHLSIQCKVCIKEGKPPSPAIVILEKETGDKKLIKYSCGHFVVVDIPKPPDFSSIIFDGSPDCKHTFTLPVKATHKTICSKCNAKRPYPFQVTGMEMAFKSFKVRNGFAILD